MLGGVTPLSTTDWPGKLAAVVFLQGCPWRCSYCHNAGLQPRCASAGAPRWPDLLDTLRRRVGLLDGVVFSGGEPTAQAGLAPAMRAAKRLGYRIGLHTAGIYPKRLAEVLPLVDWAGFDVKAPFSRYEDITAVPASGERARESMRTLLASGVAYELRTTVDDTLLDEAALVALEAELARMGARHHVRQACRRPVTGAAGRGA